MTPAEQRGRVRRETEPEPEPAADLDELCDALGDERNLALIRALGRSEGGMTAGELAEEAGIPESTVYRRMDGISDTALVRGAVALARDGGPQATRYDLALESVTLTFSEDGLAVEVSDGASSDGE